MPPKTTPTRFDLTATVDKAETVRRSMKHFVERNLPAVYKTQLLPLLEELRVYLTAMEYGLNPRPDTERVTPEENIPPLETEWERQAREKLRQKEAERSAARRARAAEEQSNAEKGASDGQAGGRASPDGAVSERPSEQPKPLPDGNG